MKLTLLDLVQNILSSMDSDEVNTISDTVESRQVAQIIKTAYYNIIARSNLPEHENIFTLDASGDDVLPVIMYKPDNVIRIDWIKYNVENTNPPNEPLFRYVTILPLQQYLDLVTQFNPHETNVESFIFNNYNLYFMNDRQPCYCTIINDKNIIFDSFNSAVDTTLQSSKTLCFGQTVPTFVLSDSFTPDLDDQQFPLLLNEAKALAFFELKQQTHQKAEQESRRQWVTLQRTKNLNRPSDFDNLPNFGRMNNRYGSNRRFREK